MPRRPGSGQRVPAARKILCCQGAPVTVREAPAQISNPATIDMPAPHAAFRLLTLMSAMTGGVVTAMVVQIMLGRRGIALTGVHLSAGAGGHFRAALAWWAMAGAAFLASFVIGAVMSRISWLYLRSLRAPAAAALVLALASVSQGAPVPAETAAAHALATLAAIVVAMMMAGFGAYFAVRG